MSKVPSARDFGYGDVVRDPKPTKAARWKRSIRAARLYADQWCRKYVKTVWDRCVTCGSQYNLQWAHVLSGKGDAVRWDVDNMTRQCEKCNNLHEYEPEHLTAWFIRERGQGALFDLVVRSNRAVKRTYSDIMKIGDSYREIVETRKARAKDPDWLTRPSEEVQPVELKDRSGEEEK